MLISVAQAVGLCLHSNGQASEEISARNFNLCRGYHDFNEVFNGRVTSLRKSIMQEITIIEEGFPDWLERIDTLLTLAFE